VPQFTLKIAAFPESAADITSQPGNSTAHMRSIARMTRKAFGTGPAERDGTLLPTSAARLFLAPKAEVHLQSRYVAKSALADKPLD